MICAECQAQGLKSKVTPGTGWETLLGWRPFYDEEGRFHSHNPNVTTRSYECSNGHEWTVKEKKPCPTCRERP